MKNTDQTLPFPPSCRRLLLLLQTHRAEHRQPEVLRGRLLVQGEPQQRENQSGLLRCGWKRRRMNNKEINVV